MRRTGTNWLSSLLIVAAIIIGVVAWVASSTHWWSSSDSALRGTSGTPASFAFTKGSFSISDRQTRPIDSCTVTSADGQTVATTPLSGKADSNGYQAVLRFTVPRAGDYTILCQGKTDGREFTITATAAPLDLVLNPLAWLALVTLIGGFILSFRHGRRVAQARARAGVMTGANPTPYATPYVQPGQYPSATPFTGAAPGGQYPPTGQYPPASQYPPGTPGPGGPQPYATPAGYPPQPGYGTPQTGYAPQTGYGAAPNGNSNQSPWSQPGTYPPGGPQVNDSGGYAQP